MRKLFFLVVLFFILIGCEEEAIEVDPPLSSEQMITVETIRVTFTDECVYSYQGAINNLNDRLLSERGFCFSYDRSEPNLTNARVITVDSTGLTPDQIIHEEAPESRFRSFFIRAYAKVEGQVYYGDVLEVRDVIGAYQARRSWISCHNDSLIVMVAGAFTGEDVGQNLVLSYSLRVDGQWQAPVEWSSRAEPGDGFQFTVGIPRSRLVEAIYLEDYHACLPQMSSIVAEINLITPESTRGVVARASLPDGGRREASSFSLGEKGYVVAGKRGETILGAMFAYDPATDSWTEKAALPQPMLSATAFSIGDTAYVGGGIIQELPNRRPVGTTEFWRYDEQSGSWIEIAPLPLPPDEFPYSGVGFSIGDYGYVGLFPPNYDTFFKYDPRINEWTSIAPFPVSLMTPVLSARNTSFVINGKAYVIIGESPTNANSTAHTCFVYDPATNTWEERAPLPMDVDDAWGFSRGNKGYVVGGFGNGLLLEYDPILNSWQSYCLDGQEEMAEAVGFAVNGEVYVGTGLRSMGTGTYQEINDWYQVQWE